jgi:hypothetical protein
MKKTEKELQEDLLNTASLAVHAYEEYLLDMTDWKHLAKVMTSLRKSVEGIDKKKLDRNEI